jgi:hypothetical protein
MSVPRAFPDGAIATANAIPFDATHPRKFLHDSN